ncbi:MAG TPA: urate hydroxylase PuuD [Polyangia bacterium]|jgi:uncharacterized membrane protein|nr:urate hydroxylase PuuD [Polyangia bacterium]
MDGTWSEWLNLILRWFHVFAGILWIGQTYYFTWLDHRIVEAEAEAVKMAAGGHPQVWMVHSGGFYIVEKQKVPELLPRKLHWFRWEAAFTWLSGFLLLGLVYYHGGLMVDEMVSNISTSQAILLSVGLLIAGWVVYDLFWLSPLGRSETVGAAICYVLVVGTVYGLSHVFSGRAAYLQLGAMFGTIMAANVWMRILPAQRALIAATKEGKAPDLRLATRAKTRSKHNTFMVMPLVFTMLSNHFPGTYGSDYRWVVLSVLVLAGWGAAKILRSH